MTEALGLPVAKKKQTKKGKQKKPPAKCVIQFKTSNFTLHPTVTSWEEEEKLPASKILFNLQENRKLFCWYHITIQIMGFRDMQLGFLQWFLISLFFQKLFSLGFYYRTSVSFYTLVTLRQFLQYFSTTDIKYANIFQVLNLHVQ